MAWMKLLRRLQTRCVSKLPSATECRWIQRQSYMWSFSWRIRQSKKKRIRVMRTWKWIVTASLLVSLSAVAQQTTAVQASGQNSTAPAASNQSAATPAAPAAGQAAATSPTTMDQVVDRTIERGHALMTMLKERTPLVETYLQNLKLDPQMGPVPKED